MFACVVCPVYVHVSVCMLLACVYGLCSLPVVRIMSSTAGEGSGGGADIVIKANIIYIYTLYQYNIHTGALYPWCAL